MRIPREFLTRNWFAKLFSVVLATMLWITISGEANSEIGIIVPLEYRNVPHLLEITGDTTNSVEVRLRGPGTLIKAISPQDISATVDLGGIRPGEKIVQLTQRNVRVPFGVDIVRVNPAQIRLNLERTLSKTIPVLVKISGEPLPGFKVRETSVTPATVEIQGPESKVRSMEAVPTASIKVDGRNADFTETVDLDLPDPMIRIQRLSPVEVRVNIRDRN